MRKIRIINTPPGEAPEDIRKAWVGLVLPLSSFRPRRKTWDAGVLTGPKTFFGFLAAAVSGRLKPQVVYVVVGHIAVDTLAGHSPDAAAWWREHAPHVLKVGWRLCFAAEACEEIHEPTSTAPAAQCSSSKGFLWYVGLWAVLTVFYWLACHFSRSLNPYASRLLVVAGRTPVFLLFMYSFAGALWTLGKMLGLALRMVKDCTFGELVRNFFGSLLLIILFSFSLATVGRMDTDIQKDETPTKSLQPTATP